MRSVNTSLDELGVAYQNARLNVNTRKMMSRELPYVVLVVTMAEPYMDLKEYFQAACTGTLIRKDLVITAATCLQIDPYEEPEPGNTKVYQRDGSALRALKIFVHPQYWKKENYNLAMIVVSKSKQVEFPALPTKMIDLKDEISSCVLAGYGKQSRPLLENFRVTIMNETSVDVIPCRQRGIQRICLHFRTLSPCVGDTGSPLICGGVLHAIYTPRFLANRRDPRGCIDRYGSVFTPVHPIMEWVDRVVSAPTPYLEWMNNPWYILLLCITVLAIIAGIYYALVEWMQKTFGNKGEDDVSPTATEDQSTAPSTHSFLSNAEPTSARGKEISAAQKYAREKEKMHWSL